MGGSKGVKEGKGARHSENVWESKSDTCIVARVLLVRCLSMAHVVAVQVHRLILR